MTSHCRQTLLTAKHIQVFVSKVSAEKERKQTYKREATHNWVESSLWTSQLGGVISVDFTIGRNVMLVSINFHWHICQFQLKETVNML